MPQRGKATPLPPEANGDTECDRQESAPDAADPLRREPSGGSVLAGVGDDELRRLRPVRDDGADGVSRLACVDIDPNGT